MSSSRHSLVTLGKQTLVYGLSGAALQFIGLITLPVFSRVFTPAQYGVIELGNVTFSLLAVITDGGLASASQRNYYEYTDADLRKRATVLLTAVVTSVGIGAVLALGLGAASVPLSHELFRRSGYASVLLVVAVTLPVNAASQFGREALRLHFRAWHYLTSAVLAAAVAATVSLVDVLAFGSGVVGLFIGTLAGSAAASLYGAVVTRRYFGPGLSRHELRSMLAYGLPLLLPGLAVWGLSFVDRFLLVGLSSLREVGEYAIANRLATVVLFLVTAFGTAFSPFIMSIYSEDREAERQVRARALNLLTLALVGVAVPLGLFAREVILVIAPGYRTAYESVGLLMIGATAFGLTSIVLFGISITRQTKWAAIYSAISALVNVGLNVALIPISGQVGSAAATAVSFALLAFLYYRKSQELYPTPYESRRINRILLLSLPPLALGLVRIHPLGLSIGVKAIALIAFVVVLRLTHSVTPDEIEQALELVRGRLRPRPAA